MSNQMPDSIARVLLAALNAADELVERNAEYLEPVRAEVVPAVKALADLDCQNRFVATIRLSLDKFRSAS